MEKTIKTSIFLVLVVATSAVATLLTAPFSVTAQVPDYVPLSPLPKTVTNDDCIANPTTCTTNLTKYATGAFKLAILIAAVLAVLALAAAGIQYMMTDSIPSKGSAKEKIQNAVFGLLLALGAYLILLTINPELLNLRLLEDLNRINARLAELSKVEFVELPINGLLNQYTASISNNSAAARQERIVVAELNKRVEELSNEIDELEKVIAVTIDPIEKANLEADLAEKRQLLAQAQTQKNTGTPIAEEKDLIYSVTGTFGVSARRAILDAGSILASFTPRTLDDVTKIQDDLRVKFNSAIQQVNSVTLKSNPEVLDALNAAKKELADNFNNADLCIESQKTCWDTKRLAGIAEFNACLAAIPKNICP